MVLCGIIMFGMLLVFFGKLILDRVRCILLVVMVCSVLWLFVFVVCR